MLNNYNFVAKTSYFYIFVQMLNAKSGIPRKLLALLLLVVMLMVNLVKGLHTHVSFGCRHSSHSWNVLPDKGEVHAICFVCEFQLAKDSLFTGTTQFFTDRSYFTSHFSERESNIYSAFSYPSENRGPPVL